MSPTLNRSSAIWLFEHSDAIEIRDGINFDFYMGLPYLCKSLTHKIVSTEHGFCEKPHDMYAMFKINGL